MSTQKSFLVTRNVRQICSPNGDAYTASITSNKWVGYNKTEFSSPKDGNKITPFTTGKDYFSEFISCCEAAQSEILIAGWQINWDAMLAPGIRLYDLLLKVARKKTVKIRIMPWDDTNPVQTYDDETKYALYSINKEVGADDIVHIYLSKELPDESKSFFSHHQKQVVIDRKIAFVGGIDLAYGRYDDETYSLKADDAGRNGLNRYNPCIPHLGHMRKDSIVDPALLEGTWDNRKGGPADKTRRAIRDGGALQAETGDYYVSGTTSDATLDPQRQPRMPWQDIQLKIEGPSVLDLTANFALRWNINPGVKLNNNIRVEVPFIRQYQTEHSSPEGCGVQVLRSAPLALRKAEYAALNAEAKLGQTAPTQCQDDIYRAMKLLIEKAQHYIYIENQFFVSGFGTENPPSSDPLSGPSTTTRKGKASGVNATRAISGDADALPGNTLCKALGDRICAAITHCTKPDFHVYIVLPVHPEGKLNDGPIMTQIHTTMQSLVFGSHSLVNRIKAALLANKRPEEEWTQYLTLLNLRNWAVLGKEQRYVSEQIYVHSKLMIVDDRYVLVGSANINERSLLGSRDSELAVLVSDNQQGTADICGNGKPVAIRHFAHNLRKKLWRKLFGLDLTSRHEWGGASPAKELQSAIDTPASPKSWQAIAKRAAQNAAAYEAAFDWVPRNIASGQSNESEGASIWPRWVDNKKTNITGPDTSMPFDDSFWDSPQASTNGIIQLVSIKGFITSLPIKWTKGENNNWGYHSALTAKIDIQHTQPDNPPKIETATLGTTSSSTEGKA